MLLRPEFFRDPLGANSEADDVFSHSTRFQKIWSFFTTVCVMTRAHDGTYSR